MAYDPAELKLPAWLLKLLNALIWLRLPVTPGWRLGMTRPGVMFVAALVAIWAAAFYSANNLLYLCGAMMLALMAAAVAQAALLLRQFPDMQDTLPLLEAGQATALRQPLPASDTTGRGRAGLNISAVVDVSWAHAGHNFALVGRGAGRQMQLYGTLHTARRGVFHIVALQLHTSAPLGLFVLTCKRHDPFDMIVLPAPAQWAFRLAGFSGSSGVDAAGDRADEGDQWRDLRPYAPGDALARVHWRKADGDIRHWVVKRFDSASDAAECNLLRVDLRMPAGVDGAAFEQLLGRAYCWARQHEGVAATLVLGQAVFELAEPEQYRLSMCALAAAQPEPGPPAGQGGLLLHLT